MRVRRQRVRHLLCATHKYHILTFEPPAHSRPADTRSKVGDIQTRADCAKWLCLAGAKLHLENTPTRQEGCRCTSAVMRISGPAAAARQVCFVSNKEGAPWPSASRASRRRTAHVRRRSLRSARTAHRAATVPPRPARASLHRKSIVVNDSSGPNMKYGLSAHPARPLRHVPHMQPVVIMRQTLVAQTRA